MPVCSCARVIQNETHTHIRFFEGDMHDAVREGQSLLDPTTSDALLGGHDEEHESGVSITLLFISLVLLYEFLSDRTSCSTSK